MTHALDLLLPSLTSLDQWTYWLLALCVMLEAIVLAGLLVPGAVAVLVGGMLARHGAVDLTDLAWFIAAGAFLGSEISYALGRLAAGPLRENGPYFASPYAQRAAALVRQHGGWAVVAGRFRGPLAGFVPFSAAMAGMRHRRFLAWNALSALAFALILPGLGYLLGAALGTLGAAAPRMLVFGTAALVGLALVGWIALRIRRALPLLVAVIRAMARGLVQRPRVRAAIDRHPAVVRFVRARFGTDQFLGLTATVLAVLFVYVLGAYVESVSDFLGTESVVSSDTRIANLLFALRDDRLIAFFGWITEIGGATCVITMLVGASMALVPLRRWDLLGGMWIAAVGNQVTVTLLKSFFGRPRSGLGYFIETSASFPSGHAAGSVAAWAMLFYLAWRLRLLPAAVAGLAAVTLAFLIGLSRVYLVEHYLSDVLNGYLVGTIWLILGIGFCEWQRRRNWAAPRRWQRGAALGVTGLTVIAAITLSFVTVGALNTVAARASIALTDPAQVLAQPGVPETTETLTGDPRQAVNLIVVAPDAAALRGAVQAAGWTDAPRPGLGVLALALWDELTRRTLPEPLVIPTFWDNHPSSLGFERRPASLPGDQRLHLRFWDSRFRTDAGDLVFVGTLTQEDPLNWAMDSDDAEKAGPRVTAPLGELAAGLQAAGVTAFLP